MKKFLKILFVIFIIVNLYSLIPIVSFYLEKPSAFITTNQQVGEKLGRNKEPYFSFIVMSDTGSGLFMNEAATLKIISKINREDRFKKIPIDFVANVGDITFRGEESHYKNYLKIKDKIKFPVINAIGNHDDDLDNGPRGLALFNKYFGVEEFSFVDRNSYFIVLDNKDGDFIEEQFTRLEDELIKAKNYKHVFIFMHKPPFNPYQQAWYRVETNPWSHRFLKLCDKYNVDIVFSGHENVSRIVKFGSVTYIVCGGGGSLLLQPTSAGGFLNYIFVKVNKDYIDYEIRKVSPPIWEFFAYYMWKDLIYFLQGLLN
ncbi:MAG: metallophosphoesterase [Candidatus Omnitrophota bacterium]|nr:MAG: metallophosphoesterase [Candidatus Omnitrophota bacterium]